MPRSPDSGAAGPSRRPNLFAGGGVATVGDDFTDRAAERKALAAALRTPKAHVLLVGPRRIGKTSLLLAVRDDLARAKPPQPVLYVDLWSASTIEDVTTRLAQEASRVLGKSWPQLVKSLATRLQLTLTFTPTPDGHLLPAPALGVRDAPAADQRTRLESALDVLNAQAKQQGVHLGVILDEFQEIERVGRDADDAPDASTVRQLRACIQHHAHVTYVFAGSDRVLIEKLAAPKHGPLHNLARRYEIGPLPEEHFAHWLEDRFKKMGIAAPQCGSALIAVAGPRTRDVRTLAESAAELARESGRLAVDDLERALETIVAERRPQYEAMWKELTMLQQNCLRAVAYVGTGLTRQDVLERFALGAASRTTKSLAQLVERGLVQRDDAGAYSYDDPFFRAWVIVTALPDVGLILPASHRPEQ